MYECECVGACVCVRVVGGEEREREFSDFNFLSTAQGHLRTSCTFKSCLYQFHTQVIKPQIKSRLTILDTTQSTALLFDLFTNDRSIIGQVLCKDLIDVRQFIKSQVYV